MSANENREPIPSDEPREPAPDELAEAKRRFKISWLDWLGSRKTKSALIGSIVVGVGAATSVIPPLSAFGIIASLWGLGIIGQAFADHGAPPRRP